MLNIGTLLWNGLLGAISWGFLAYLIGIGILFFLRAKGLLKRDSNLGKAFVVSYWIFIPMFLAWMVTAVKLVGAAKQSVQTSAGLVIDQIDNQIFPVFHDYVTNSVDSAYSKMNVPSNEALVGDFMTEYPKMDTWVTRKLMISFIDILEEHVANNLSDQTGVTTENILAIRDLEPGSIDGVYKDAMNDLKGTSDGLIGSLFTPYYLIIYGVWILLMLFPVIEIIRNARKTKKETESPTILSTRE